MHYSHGGGPSGRAGNAVPQQQQQQHHHHSDTRLLAPPASRVPPTQQYLAPPQGSLPPPHGYHRTSGAAAGGGDDRDYAARMGVPRLSNMHLHQPLMHHQPGAVATAPQALPTPVMGGVGGITAAAALQQQQQHGGGSNRPLARPGAWMARPNDGGHMSGRVASMAPTANSGLVAPRQSPTGGAAQPRQQQQQSAAAPTTGVAAQLSASNANRGRFSVPPALHNATAGRLGNGTRPGGGVPPGIPHALVGRRPDGHAMAAGGPHRVDGDGRSIGGTLRTQGPHQQQLMMKQGGGGGGVRIPVDPSSSTGGMAGGKTAGGKRGIPVPSQAGDISGIRRDVRLLTQLAAAATSPQATVTSQQSSSAPGGGNSNSIAGGGQQGPVFVSEEALELLSNRILDFAADVAMKGRLVQLAAGERVLRADHLVMGLDPDERKRHRAATALNHYRLLMKQMEAYDDTKYLLPNWLTMQNDGWKDGGK